MLRDFEARDQDGLRLLILAGLRERWGESFDAKVRVLTDTPWQSAVSLYRACGFTELGDDGVDTHFRLPLGPRS